MLPRIGYDCDVISEMRCKNSCRLCISGAMQDPRLTNAIAAHQAGKLSEAETIYRALLNENPNNADALHMLGLATHSRGNVSEAENLVRKAISLEPKFPAFRSNLAEILRVQLRFAEAKEQCNAALQMDPYMVIAWQHLGQIFEDQFQFAEAENAYRKMVGLEPTAFGKVRLSAVLSRLNKHAEAQALAEEARQEEPNNTFALLRCAGIYRAAGEIEAARRMCERAVELEPKNTSAINLMGNLSMDIADFPSARLYYGRTLEFQPNDASAKFSMGLLELLQGNLREGWSLYENRFEVQRIAKYQSGGAQWDGTDIHGKILLIRCEQGIGDTLQFVRYAKILKRQFDCKIWATAPESLIPLLKQIKEVDQWFDRKMAISGCDCWAYMMDLPKLLKHERIEELPAEVPYLLPDPERVLWWGERLKTDKRLRIGISWQGNTMFAADHGRSFPLEKLKLAVPSPDIQWVSLQKFEGVDQIKQNRSWLDIVDLGDELDSDGQAFMDTAAIIANLDLVIASDSAVAHLAGAMGAPVWIPLALTPDWRWFLDRTDCPWYPTATLFRQRDYRDWDQVFRAIGRELEGYMPTGRQETAREAAVNMIATRPRHTVSVSSKQPALASETAAVTLDCGAFNRLTRAKHGWILYNRFDMYIGKSIEMLGEFSEEEIDLFHQWIKPGNIVIEAGANIGTHTVPLAKLVGRDGVVVAYEPQRVVFQTLCANLALNSIENVHARCACLGAKNGVAFMPSLNYSSTNNFGGVSALSGGSGEQCNVQTIDGLGLPRVDFIKADVEGMELDVLLGAQKTIAQHKPFLYLEHDRPEKAQAVAQHLTSIDYLMFEHRPKLYRPNNHFQNANNPFGNIISANIVAVHKSRLNELQGKS